MKFCNLQGIWYMYNDYCREFVVNSMYTVHVVDVLFMYRILQLLL